jgi:hypothetical protein
MNAGADVSEPPFVETARQTKTLRAWITLYHAVQGEMLHAGSSRNHV